MQNTQEINDKLSIFIGGQYLIDQERWHFNCLSQPAGSNSPNFHEDWNWLNKVIDKIEDLEYSFIKIGLHTKIIYSMDIVKYNCLDYVEPICENGGDVYRTNIESTYNTCNDFVDWYNKNNY